MKILFSVKPKGLIAAILALLVMFVSAVLYESGIIDDGFYLKLVNSVKTEVTSQALEVHFVDVGQGECILVKALDKNILIDCGEVGWEDEVTKHLHSKGVFSLDLFIITHPHTDHMGCADEILKKFPVKTVILPEIPEEFLPTTFAFENMLKTLSRKNCEVYYAKGGEVFELGEGATLEILSTDYSGDNLNNYSVISKLTYGKISFLFTGDAEEEIEEQLAAGAADISATVFSAGHHGSTTSNSAVFLRAVNPEYCAISCGRNNDYGHPHREITERLNDYKIKYYRTDYCGNITFKSDGENITVETEK